MKKDKYKEVEKPEYLKDSKETLYYMYSNRHDVLGESYQKITTQDVLEIAYKVYVKVEE